MSGVSGYTDSFDHRPHGALIQLEKLRTDLGGWGSTSGDLRSRRSRSRASVRPAKQAFTRLGRRRRRRMSTKLSTQYHPFLFLLLMLCAMAELGLGVYMIVTGYEHEYWPSSRYRAL